MYWKYPVKYLILQKILDQFSLMLQPENFKTHSQTSDRTVRTRVNQVFKISDPSISGGSGPWILGEGNVILYAK